ncbi:hypothetical protein AAMO2058_001439400 [Amorphochlora amoebiformis]
MALLKRASRSLMSGGAVPRKVKIDSRRWRGYHWQSSAITPDLEFSVELTDVYEDLKPFSPQLKRYGGRVYLPFVKNNAGPQILEASQRLLDLGCQPVPHLTVRRLGGMDSVQLLLEQWYQVGVRDVFLIGGDVDAPLGKLHSSMQVLEAGVLQASGFHRVGMAFHPEGNPLDPDHAATFHAKLSWMHTASTSDVYFVSQPCLSSAQVNTRLEALSPSIGNTEMWIGLAGPATVKRLVKFAKLCGVSTSFRLLQSNGLEIAAQALNITPITSEHLVDEIYNKRFHVFAVGGMGATLEWIDEMQQSRARQMELCEGKEHRVKAGL